MLSTFQDFFQLSFHFRRMKIFFSQLWDLAIHVTPNQKSKYHVNRSEMVLEDYLVFIEQNKTHMLILSLFLLAT